MIPIYPLDGGRILKEVLIILVGKRKALKLINYISNVLLVILTCSLGLIAYHTHNIAIIFMIFFLWGIIIKENKKYRIMRKIYNLIQ